MFFFLKEDEEEGMCVCVFMKRWDFHEIWKEVQIAWRASRLEPGSMISEALAYLDTLKNLITLCGEFDGKHRDTEHGTTGRLIR